MRCVGPFRLVRQLGHGGSAPVWLAEDVFEGRKLRDVAIKLFFVPERIASSPDAALRWREGILEEARALCRVEHPSIVRFYALHRDDARGVIGLAMEHVAGSNLEALAGPGGRLGERVVVEAALAVAWALAAVHAAGLVHRDVKPSNIVQGATGYKLIDFGIAALTDLHPGGAPSLSTGGEGAPTIEIPDAAGGGTQTVTAAVVDPEEGIRRRLVGTLGYIQPERYLRDDPATPAGDLYALGVTLVRLLSGRMPHELTDTAAPGSGSMAAAVRSRCSSTSGMTAIRTSDPRRRA
jgi:serine/threonine protein kinase